MIPVIDRAMAIIFNPMSSDPEIKRIYAHFEPKYISKITTSISKTFFMNLSVVFNNSSMDITKLSMGLGG